eukprot:8779155-Pyramimonas_sp.AAC.1
MGGMPDLKSLWGSGHPAAACQGARWRIDDAGPGGQHVEVGPRALPADPGRRGPALRAPPRRVGG